MMDETLFNLLKRVDTPTVCNAIEVAQGKRGFNAFTRGTVQHSNPAAPAMLGYARTARIRALSPPEEAPDVIRRRRMDYYRYMSEGPRPAVAVVEDADYPNAVGAFWGEINAAVHLGFKLSGVLTNGVMRDLGDVPEDFPMIAGSIGPSHGFVHVLEMDQPVTVFGMQVKPGALVHADRHGAVEIPEQVIVELARAIETLLHNEQLVLGPACKEGFNFETFQAAWSAVEKART